MQDEDFMIIAIEEAEKSIEEGNWPIGCVIVLDGKIIARAHNKIYTSHDRTAHAEMNAIIESQTLIFKRPLEATLYTTFEPCPMCFGACINSRLKKVVYGADFNNSGAVHLKDYLPDLYKDGNYETEFKGGVLIDECKEIYSRGEKAVLEAKRKLVEKP